MKKEEAFNFGDLLDGFVQKQREENTWVLDIPEDLTQDEVNSLVWGSEDHIRLVLPPMSQIIMHTPEKFLEGVRALNNANVHE